jgi:hypothetical protein
MKTIEDIENKPALGEIGVFDISELLIAEEEVVKKILIMESNLSEEDADLMVYGFVDDLSGRKKSKSQKELESLLSEGDTKFKRSLIREEINNSIEEISGTDTGAPLSSKSSMRKKAREILNLIKEKITQFFRKVKELIREIGTSVVSVVSSIPGATLLVSPLAFNIPGMITMLMQIVHLLSLLSSKFADLASFFKHFKMLPLVLSPSDLNKVSNLINKSYTSVSTAFNPLEISIKNFNKTYTSIIRSQLNNPRPARSITSRLRKLNYIKWSSIDSEYTIKGIENVDEDDKDEVEDILEQWEVVFLDRKRSAVRRKKIIDSDGNEIDTNSLLGSLDNIDDILNEIKINLPEVSESDDFIYDVQFSDGRSLFGITKQEVDGLEVTYNVIYSENVKYSFR